MGKGKAKKEPNLDRGLLLDLAGERSFQRGCAYFEGGQVTGLLLRDGTATAEVAGSRDYRVRLELGRSGVEDFACTCPVGQDGDFCKHCVAVGLALIEEAVGLPADGGGKAKKKRKQARSRVPDWDDVAAYVRAMDRERLAGLLLEAAKRDDALYRRLLRDTASAAGPDSAAETCRAHLEAAFETGGFVDYEDAYGYAEGIEEALGSLDALLASGAATETMALAEFAFARLARAVESMDDSDGHCSEIGERLKAIHLRACERAKPEPAALARALFELEMADEYGFWGRTIPLYAKVLGSRGIEAFRSLVKGGWAGLPEGGPRERDRTESRRHTLQVMSEELARLSGDVEAFVAAKSRALASSWDYLEIAEVYRKARKPEKAIEWAEKGVRAHPDTWDHRLHDFLAEAYLKRGRAGEAMALVWRQFEKDPRLDPYERLATFAKKAGLWPVWREKALAHLRERVGRAKGGTARPWERNTGHSRLVEIFLWEGDGDAAWREAQAGGCSDELWLELAKRREKKHPEDALLVYLRLAGSVTSRTGEGAYREARKHLQKAKALLERLGRPKEFASFIAGLREANRRKRNLIRLIADL